MSLSDVKVGRRFRLWNSKDKFFYLATVEGIDFENDELTVKYNKDDCMKKEILDLLPDTTVKVGWDTIKNKIKFIFEGEVICPVCGSDDFNDLYLCSKSDQHEVGYHGACISPSSGYIVPNDTNMDTWLCPMHQREARNPPKPAAKTKSDSKGVSQDKQSTQSTQSTEAVRSPTATKSGSSELKKRTFSQYSAGVFDDPFGTASGGIKKSSRSPRSARSSKTSKTETDATAGTGAAPPQKRQKLMSAGGYSTYSLPGASSTSGASGASGGSRSKAVSAANGANKKPDAGVAKKEVPVELDENSLKMKHFIEWQDTSFRCCYLHELRVKSESNVETKAWLNEVGENKFKLAKSRKFSNSLLNVLNKSKSNSMRKIPKMSDERNGLNEKQVTQDSKYLSGIKEFHHVYPTHFECLECSNARAQEEEMINEVTELNEMIICDGKRPCTRCFGLAKFELKNSNDKRVIHTRALEICQNRLPVMQEIENDAILKLSLSVMDEIRFEQLLHYENGLKREKTNASNASNASIEFNEEAMELMDDEVTTIKKEKEEEARVKQKEEERIEMKMVNFDSNISANDKSKFIKEFKHQAAVVPMNQTFCCQICKSYFSTLIEWRMHKYWCHEYLLLSNDMDVNFRHWKNAKYSKQFASCKHKKHRFGCPYAACLRASDSLSEIHNHIVRHHDVTDPTKYNIKQLKQLKFENAAYQQKVNAFLKKKYGVKSMDSTVLNYCKRRDILDTNNLYGKQIEFSKLYQFDLNYIFFNGMYAKWCQFERDNAILQEMRRNDDEAKPKSLFEINENKNKTDEEKEKDLLLELMENEMEKDPVLEYKDFEETQKKYGILKLCNKSVKSFVDSLLDGNYDDYDEIADMNNLNYNYYHLKMNSLENSELKAKNEALMQKIQEKTQLRLKKDKHLDPIAMPKKVFLKPKDGYAKYLNEKNSGQNAFVISPRSSVEIEAADEAQMDDILLELET